MNESVVSNGGKVSAKDRILDSAEELFAEQGFAPTSLRQITTKANVNLAAVNYHFQSKEALIEAVVRRRITPLNARRIELLDELEARTAHPTLEELMHALVWPVFEAVERGTLGHFPRIMGRLFSEPGDFLQKTLAPTLTELFARFRPLVLAAVPGLQRETLAWALHMGIGSMAHVLAGQGLLKMLAGGQSPDTDTVRTTHQLVAYISAGTRAITQLEEK